MVQIRRSVAGTQQVAGNQRVDVDDELAELARQLRACGGDAASEFELWSQIDALLDRRLAERGAERRDTSRTTC